MESGDGERSALSSGYSAVVFCGAKPGKNPLFGEKAAELGACLASRGVEVVYGGSRYGCMGRLADAVVEGGGKLTGIVPRFFTEMEGYSAAAEEIVVADMHTRKKMFFERANMFISLPGGLGTMEELTEMLTWYNLGLHKKPIGILNVTGYYDHFLHWLSRAREEGFVAEHGEMPVVSDSPQDLVNILVTASCKQ